MTPLFQKIAQQKADAIMSLNRHQRRAFKKKNNIPIKIAGSNKPINHGEEANKETA